MNRITTTTKSKSSPSLIRKSSTVTFLLFKKKNKIDQVATSRKSETIEKY